MTTTEHTLSYRRRLLVHGVCLALTGGAIAHADNAIQAVSPSHFLELVNEIPLEGSGVGLDLTASPSGVLYLSDQSQGGIRRLASDDAAWQILISSDPKADLPRHPASIEVGTDARLWIADTDRRRVVVVGASGDPAETYQDRQQLDKPTRLARALDGSMTVWDVQSNRLVRLNPTTSSTPPTVSVVASHPGADFCVPAQPSVTYCVATDRKTVTRHAAGETSATWTAPGTYPRLADLHVGPHGEVFMIDTAGRRLYRSDPQLAAPLRLRLYEPMLQSPTRLALAGDQLWLLDEGRKSILHLRLRTAETAWEHAILGEEYLGVGLADSALGELTTAQRLGLDHPDVILNLGAAQYDLGDFRAALDAWERLPPELRDSTQVRFRRANALFRLGHYKDAALLFEGIEPTASEYPTARFNLAQANRALGDDASAYAALTELLAAAPEHERARLSLAMVLIGLGRDDEANRLLDALAQGGGAVSGEAAFSLGQRRLAAGDLSSAVALLEQAARLGPHYRSALTTLAIAHRQRGDEAQARLYEQRAAALELDTTNLATLILENAP
ncbi:hypothetical protein CKO25_17935 [Thiocapsa imhoffii]|uniref:Tetratricopeptide repeat protein n=1 Tax=Thiocapsa imhoffii TaxID=382777 RepID=A0A9X1BBA2_9GAMM|nr:tetratricopeptide repeat protein [Thiocapsa imhoffii]MBK1646491.1 hypothetical protein [Thiocapsa imhoffii]